MAKPLISVPKTAKKGDVIEIRTLIAHIMETGFRHSESGATIPRDIIHSFKCDYNGTEIFRADLSPAIAANPFIAFTTVATESGQLTFAWTDDRGETQRETIPITVE
jgi:sulfur-oxidizing protein SoxZ